MDMIMNLEIIPNWHPILVHFTIGLLSISALFYFAGAIFKKEAFLIVGRWNLWIGAAITAGTIAAGFYAYYTVQHDAPSHAAMTDHRNWALFAASLFIILALWALCKHRGAKTVNPFFVAVILLASGFLAVAGYKGGEVVYRHGAGVMRMPEVHGDGGHGSHAHGGAGDNHGAIKAKTAEPNHHGTPPMAAPADTSVDAHTGHQH